MTNEIDKNSDRPLYLQLKEVLTEQISKGQYGLGDSLPTESQLCEKYSVSRTTVRQAISELTSDGYLERRRGSGTYVVKVPGKDIIELNLTVPDPIWEEPLDKAKDDYNSNLESSEREIKLNTEIIRRRRLRKELIGLIARGSAPDIALIDSVWLSEFADRHYIFPLDELSSNWIQEFSRDVYPVFIERNQYNDSLYGIQIESNVGGVWYRKDILNQEGLHPPETWQDLVNVSKHLKQPKVRKKYGLDEYPLAFCCGKKAGETTTYQLLSLIYSSGGSFPFIKDKDVTKDKKSLTEALKFLKGLKFDHKVAYPEACSFKWNKPAKLFAQGQVALSFGGSYEWDLIEDITGWTQEAFEKQVGFAPFPKGPGGRRTSTVGGMAYSIFQQSEEPELALELLKKASSKEIMAQFSRKHSRKPTRISLTRDIDSKSEPFLYHTTKLFDFAALRPTIIEYSNISRVLQTVFERVYNDEESIDEAVDRSENMISFLSDSSI